MENNIGEPAGQSEGLVRELGKLFLASLAALYFELVVIRYVGTEIRVFTNLKNIPLIASFFGLGLGMILGRPRKLPSTVFPLVGLVLFAVTRYARWLRLANVDLIWTYDLLQGTDASLGVKTLAVCRFLGLVFGISSLIVSFFVVLGGFVGVHLQYVPGLRGYGWNLAGSLLGALLFSIASFLNFGPGLWLLIGFALLIPFVKGKLPMVLFLATIMVVAVPQPNTFWSPYYRIDFVPVSPPSGSNKVAAYSVVTNHMWYQWLADLSPEFLLRYPDAMPNKVMAPYYELAYRLVPHPRRVLILGAGTGNDVAAALRHGAQHVDAVELDPEILRLGKLFHPEQPYSSPRVTAHVTDARAFLRTPQEKYDLILFACLDSTTLLSGLSSIRLDNYVFTVESFTEARALLSPDGTLVLAFAAKRSFASDRLYASLQNAFQTSPVAYFTSHGTKGIFLVEGQGRAVDLSGPNTPREAVSTKGVLLATDDWPFLYLRDRSIPNSILLATTLLLFAAWLLLRRLDLATWSVRSRYTHFLLLGAGFLLLETKALTQMSLLFGTTWFVNLVVICSFLLMALLSNAVVAWWKMPVALSYFLLLAILVGDLWFPYSHLNSLGFGWRLMLGGGWASLPVLLSGTIFSTGIKKLADTGTVLGVNLFGAVLGGVLENSVMIGGTRILGFLAIAVYLASALALVSVPASMTPVAHQQNQ
jgi:SAM-dependent methyltransferase